MVIDLCFAEKLGQLKLDDDDSDNSYRLLDEKDLEDQRIDVAIKIIGEAANERRSNTNAIFKQAAVAGLKGSKDFDALLNKTKGKRVYRGTSDDSRPPKNLAS